ncbi:hypothetical protein ES705_29794 [subsurface metagenome]
MLGAIITGIGNLVGGVLDFGGNVLAGLFSGAGQAAVPVMRGGEMGSLSAASMAGGGSSWLPSFAGIASPILQFFGQREVTKIQSRSAEKIAASKLAYERDLVNRQLEQQRRLREKQMELQARQQMVESLAGIYERKGQPVTRYVTLPQPVQREESIIEQINRAIAEFFSA